MMPTTTIPSRTAVPPLVMRAALAAAFHDELLDSCETLGAIAETHGQRTLVDLFYLHAALLTGEAIDAWPTSRVVEFLQDLPSGSTWLEYVRVMDQSGEVATPAKPRRQGAGDGPIALEVVRVAVELDGYNLFDLTHTECDERFASLKQRMHMLLGGESTAALAVELADAERLLAAAGGRGVELAERVDHLREAVANQAHPIKPDMRLDDLAAPFRAGKQDG
jgi:hypothetical protein